MVSIAQQVEHQTVALRVVGSIPTAHPNNKSSGCGAIGSALALGARGCQFESGHPDHFLYTKNFLLFNFLYLHFSYLLSS